MASGWMGSTNWDCEHQVKVEVERVGDIVHVDTHSSQQPAASSRLQLIGSLVGNK